MAAGRRSPANRRSSPPSTGRTSCSLIRNAPYSNGWPWFRGGFSLDAAEAIVSGDGVDDFDVFDHLASLIDKSMIQGGADSGRFRLLETLRQFALGKLTDAGKGDAWRKRHAEFFVTLADDAFDATRGRDQVEWLERLEQDHDNMRAALTWTLEADEHEMAARIAAGLWWFWNIHGHRKAALEYFDRIIPQIGSVDPSLAVRVLSGRAVLVGFDTDSRCRHPRRREGRRTRVLAR